MSVRCMIVKTNVNDDGGRVSEGDRLLLLVARRRTNPLARLDGQVPEFWNWVSTFNSGTTNASPHPISPPGKIAVAARTGTTRNKSSLVENLFSFYLWSSTLLCTCVIAGNRTNYSIPQYPLVSCPYIAAECGYSDANFLPQITVDACQSVQFQFCKTLPCKGTARDTTAASMPAGCGYRLNPARCALDQSKYRRIGNMPWS